MNKVGSTVYEFHGYRGNVICAYMNGFENHESDGNVSNGYVF